jgi:hypothetical protein
LLSTDELKKLDDLRIGKLRVTAGGTLSGVPEPTV